jgi:hypothetical protein
MTDESDNQELARTYRTVNISLLAAALYGLTLPWLMPMLSAAIPSVFGSCASIRIFGMPCPLCGLTRGVGAVLHADIAAATLLNPLSVPVVLLILCEMGYRIAALFVAIPSHKLRVVVNADRRFHVALFAAYLVYAVAFILRHLAA